MISTTESEYPFADRLSCSSILLATACRASEDEEPFIQTTRPKKVQRYE